MPLPSNLVALLSSQFEFAADIQRIAEAFARDAASEIRGITVGSPREFSTPTIDIPSFIIPDGPTALDLPNIQISIPDIPSFLLPSLFDSPVATTRPIIDATIGDYEAPARPEQFPFTPPVVDTNIGDIDIPSLPDVTRPTLTPISIIAPPPISFPDSNVARPFFTGTIPSNLGQQLVSQYNSYINSFQSNIESQLTVALNKLFPNQNATAEEFIQQVLDGRTAITNEVEEQIFTRKKNRVEYEGFREYDEATALAIETNNPIMQPSVRAAIARVNENIAFRNAEAALTTAEERADRELAFLQLTIDTALEIKGLLVSAYSAIFSNLADLNAQALEGARDFVSTIIEVANLEIDLYNIEINAFEAELAALRDRREFLLAELERYRILVEAERIKAELNEFQIRIYEADIQASLSLLELTKVEVDVLLAKAELRKIPVEIFKLNAQAYESYVNGAAVDVEIFKSLLEADEIRINAQIAQLEGWVKEREADLVEVEINKANLTAQVEYNKVLSNIFELQTEREKIRLELERLVADIGRDNFSLDIEKFKIQANAVIEGDRAIAEANITRANLRAELSIKYQELILEFDRFNLDRNAKIADILISNTGLYESLGASILSGITSLTAGLGFEDAPQ